MAVPGILVIIVPPRRELSELARSGTRAGALLVAMGFTRGWRAVVLVMLGLVASQATGHGVAASDYAQALKEAETGRADTELLQIFRMGYEDIKDG